MARGTLLDNTWELHKIGVLPSGQDHLYVGGLRIHEVTSPQSFEGVREKGIGVRRPDLSAAVVDHVIPTTAEERQRPFNDPQAETMTCELEKNVAEFGIQYFAPGKGQGVCHVVFPEQGLVWPGMLIVCGDSHTCTYGALGAIAFGVGTTEVEHVLATQSIGMEPVKVRRINFNGQLPLGVTAKDTTLYAIREIGLDAGIGFAHEYGGEAIESMSIEGRLTACNMGVEGNARLCYINPDEKTFEYLRGKPFAPKEDFEKAVAFWKSLRSAPDAVYDDVVDIDVTKIEPMVTWGVSPDLAIGIGDRIPQRDDEVARDSFEYMGLMQGDSMRDIQVNVVFIGSCTNGRLSDLVAAAQILKGNKVKAKTLVVPGSELVKYDAEQMGLDRIFTEAGAEWREPGCSMCLGMSPDKLVKYQRSCSTSNRPFKGRQGSTTGRTHICSPYMAAATAIEGRFADPRPYLIVK